VGLRQRPGLGRRARKSPSRSRTRLGSMPGQVFHARCRGHFAQRLHLRGKDRSPAHGLTEVRMGAWRPGLAALAFVALIVVTAFGLNLFAQRAFNAHLRDQAARLLALANTGGTPYQWRFAGPEDVIAGHPFGSEDFEFDEGSLRWRGSGAVEVGMVLARTLSLRSFPRLQLDANATSAGELRVVVRERLGEQE